MYIGQSIFCVNLLLAARDVNYMVSNRKLNTYECRLYLMRFLSNAGNVADGNLSQTAEACLRLVDLLQETLVVVCCLGCQLHGK
jgi:hypothetical protein